MIQLREVFAFEVAEFVDRTNDVADEGAEHEVSYGCVSFKQVSDELSTF